MKTKEIIELCENIGVKTRCTKGTWEVLDPYSLGEWVKIDGKNGTIDGMPVIEWLEYANFSLATYTK